MRISIPPNDPRVHVLAVSDGAEDLPEQTYLTGPAPDQTPFIAALGAPVALGHVEVFKVKDLLPLSLRDYLHQAHDVPPEALDGPRLDALDGKVMVLAPAALKNIEDLRLSPLLTHIGAYGAPVPDDTPHAMPRAKPQAGPDRSAQDQGTRQRPPYPWLVLGTLCAVALLFVWLIG